MSLSRFLPFGIFPSVALLTSAYGQAPTSSPTTNAAHEPVVSLDRFVVSAGLQDKTAFDLAQGTSILAGEELRRHAQATLGETLDATPGVNSTYYGPGASRPVIRGLGGDRIRVLDGGVGALDASNISPDHNTAIEPLFAQRVEVLRGPATLLYGSSAVGGVVNVIDNRIPTEPLEAATAGAIEARGFGAADERTAVAALSAGTKDFRVQLDGLTLHTGDVRIPGVARIDRDAPANQPRGVLANSAISTDSGSLGATWFWTGGHLGAAVSTYATTYGVPTDEPISIDLKQHRFDLAGETNTASGVFRGVRMRLGFGDYTHSEIADRTTINTTFKNKAWEGRLEAPHSFAENFNGTVGVQASRSDFSAVGNEVVTPPSVTENEAVFLLEEWKAGLVTLQAGARHERQTIMLGAFDATALPNLPGFNARSGEKRNEGGTSGSLGAVFYPARDWSIGLSLAYTERLPTAQELFSNGPHGGTGAYEIGTSGLANEKSTGFDLSVRRRAGFVTGSASVFLNRFENYIFEQALDPSVVPAASNPDGLTPYQFVAKNAEFHGAETELVFHLIEKETEHLHLNVMSDYVRAEQTTDHQPLPRIPPLRFGAGLRYERDSWSFGVEARHAMRQDRVTTTETSTPGYTLLNADVTYTLSAGKTDSEFFLRGSNLTNVDARVHSSFLKDFSPLPGRGAIAGVRMKF